MKRVIPFAALALGIAVTVSAQDSTVKSKTNIKADDARVMTMTGCLRHEPSGNYMLMGTMAAAGDDVTVKSKVKTDVDKNDTTVKGKTKIDGDSVATSGVSSTYMLMPGKVDLDPHVGQRVQVSAIMVEQGHGDADVKIKEKTNVDPEHGADHTTTSKSKIELPKSSAGAYTVVSVTPMSGACS
jgi:hypothetical protein